MRRRDRNLAGLGLRNLGEHGRLGPDHEFRLGWCGLGRDRALLLVDQDLGAQVVLQLADPAEALHLRLAFIRVVFDAHPGAARGSRAGRGYHLDRPLPFPETLVDKEDLALAEFDDDVLVQREPAETPDGVGSRSGDPDELADGYVYPGLTVGKGLDGVTGEQVLPHRRWQKVGRAGAGIAEQVRFHLVDDLFHGDAGLFRLRPATAGGQDKHNQGDDNGGGGDARSYER